MKTFVLFLIRIIAVCIFEWLTYYLAPAQTSVFLGDQTTITLDPNTKVVCGSVIWLGDAQVYLQDSASWRIQKSVIGSDSVKNFFILGKDASLIRNVDTIASYGYPIGYGTGLQNYRGFILDMKSLGQTGPGFVSVKLLSHIYGTINYQKYFSLNDSSCLAGSSIHLNCLNQDGWHCDGPSDYEYIASVSTVDYCGGTTHRVIKTSTNSNAWQDSIESIVGNLGQSFCEYSELSGGRYRSFSDFAIASNVSLLPVTLIDFRADPINNAFVRLSWKTKLEINNEKFLVTRSVDGQNFAQVGELAGHGNSTTEQQYVFDDREVLPNIDYYYQLVQVDYDGASYLSSVVSAKLLSEEILFSRTFNILGQEVAADTKGLILKQVYTANGSRVFKTVVE